MAQLRVLISTRSEANRTWEPNFGALDVIVQKCITRSRTWRHPKGFTETVYTHFPYDTIPELGRYRPDVVISGEFGFRTISAAIYRLIDRRTRLIIWGTLSECTEQDRGRVREFLRKSLLHIADALVVNGHSGARYLQSFGVNPASIFLVFTTTDVAAFARVPLMRTGPAAHRMLYSGRLVERKCVLPFLRVLARWLEAHPDRTAEVVIAGDGPERGPIERAGLPPQLQLRFLGDLAYDQLPAVYAEAGVLIFPTMADEWGLVVNEALAAGVPVLGSAYAQAVEELVEEGRTGWIFRPDHEDELYAALDRFFAATESELNEMRVLARAKVIDLTPDAVVGPLVDAIRYARRGAPND